MSWIINLVYDTASIFVTTILFTANQVQWELWLDSKNLIVAHLERLITGTWWETVVIQLILQCVTVDSVMDWYGGHSVLWYNSRSDDNHSCDFMIDKQLKSELSLQIHMLLIVHLGVRWINQYMSLINRSCQSFTKQNRKLKKKHKKVEKIKKMQGLTQQISTNNSIKCSATNVVTINIRQCHNPNCHNTLGNGDQLIHIRAKSVYPGKLNHTTSNININIQSNKHSFKLHKTDKNKHLIAFPWLSGGYNYLGNLFHRCWWD